MTASSYLTTVRHLSGPRGEDEAPADRTFLAADVAEYRRDNYDGPFCPELIGPVIPWGESPRSPAMITEDLAIDREHARKRAERRFGR